MSIDCLAFDLGASGGRLICGSFNGEKISISELHRFENEMVRVNGCLYWDIIRLFDEMKKGMLKAAAAGINPRTIGIDTWGVDYGLIDKNDNLIGQTIAYRDARTDPCPGEADSAYGLNRIYDATGIQIMSFNTLFQLMADRKMRPVVYDNADRILFMPDLLGFLMTGVKYNEYTILSTGQVLDVHKASRAMGRPDTDPVSPPGPLLATDAMAALGLRTDLFADIIRPGTRIGKLLGELCRETGFTDTELIAVGSHDTASAVAGTPLKSPNSAFLSCGTWSLLGMELPEAIVSAASFDENFTNEGGVEGSIRFLKNINGLWIIQRLRKCYDDIGYGDIAAAARAAKAEGPARELAIDPTDKRFTAPEDMHAEIIGYCEEHGLYRPNNLGETALAVYNGLAREYKANVQRLEKLTNRKITEINMIGGGIRDTFLCELTARATGKSVVAGPIEGSVFGNIAMQLIALGEVRDISQARDIIDASCEKSVYLPIN